MFSPRVFPFLNPYLPEFSHTQNPENVTHDSSIKKHAHYSPCSRENAKPSNRTPLVHYY